MKKRETEIQEFVNEEIGCKVRCIQNEDGSISMNAEDTAIGFGLVQKKGEKYYPRMDRLNSFIKELGFPHVVGKDDFIPESLFYEI